MRYIKRVVFVLMIINIWIALPSNCMAMAFSQPVELGSMSALPPYGAFKITGATSNQGTLSTEKEQSGDYAKGVACFGEGAYALYVHYDNSYFYTDDFKMNVFHSKEFDKSCLIGDKDTKNTLILPLGFPHNFTIYFIKTDSKINLYLLAYNTNTLPSYKLIGRREDGRFVNYFSTEAMEKYYGMTRAFCHNYRVLDNEIIFEYGKYDKVKAKFISYAEMHFTWDDKTQWFGVNILDVNPEEPENAEPENIASDNNVESDEYTDYDY